MDWQGYLLQLAGVPSLGSLTGGLTRSLGLSAISNALKLPGAPTSAAGILRDLTGLGLGYRRQDFYRDYRTLSDAREHESSVVGATHANAFDRESYTESWFREKGRFRYVVRMEVNIYETSSREYRSVGVVSQHELSPSEVLGQAQELIEKYLDKYDFEVVDMVVTRAYHKSGTLWV